MRKHVPWLAAVVLIVIAIFASSGAFGQMQPVVTGGFAQTGPTATIILLNQSSVSDNDLARISVAINLRVANVQVATRLYGQPCNQGEWCLAVTNDMLGSSSDLGSEGAVIGAEVARAIIAHVVQM